MRGASICALLAACRGNPDPPAPPPPPHVAAAPADAAPAVVHGPVPEAPALPVLIDGGTVPPLAAADRFAAERRDDGWASPTEIELRKRVGALPAIHVDTAECHATQCKVVLSGTQGAIATAIDDLQSEKRGLRNWAAHWILGAPDRRGDQLALTAYVQFARDTT